MSERSALAKAPSRLIAGLGNPGEEYAATYHNVGKMLVNYIAEKAGVSLTVPSHKHFAYAKSAYGILVSPQSFMNISGGPTEEAMKFFEVAPQNLIVAHDDSDLPLGSYKYVLGGGSAGHHGIDSIVAALGTADFHRIRIGVRDPNEIVRRKAGDFVLDPISKTDLATLYGVFDGVIVKLSANETPF